MQDTLEQTRLDCFEHGEMDVKMARSYAIMSQWGFTAEDLETVIDKLNIIPMLCRYYRRFGRSNCRSSGAPEQ